MSDTEPLPMQPPNGHPQRNPGHGPPYPRNAPGPGHGYPPNGPGPGYGYPPGGPEPAYGYPPSGPEPGYGYPPHGPEPDYGYRQPGPDPRPGGAAPRPSRRERRPRDGSGIRRTALVVQSVADVAAAFLGLWIVLHLLEANLGNPFVGFVQDVAEWLGWWAQDIFTMSNEGVRFFLNYGLPAVLYLLAGHGFATWLRRL